MAKLHWKLWLGSPLALATVASAVACSKVDNKRIPVFTFDFAFQHVDIHVLDVKFHNLAVSQEVHVFIKNCNGHNYEAYGYKNTPTLSWPGFGHQITLPEWILRHWISTPRGDAQFHEPFQNYFYDLDRLKNLLDGKTDPSDDQFGLMFAGAD